MNCKVAMYCVWMLSLAEIWHLTQHAINRITVIAGQWSLPIAIALFHVLCISKHAQLAAYIMIMSKVTSYPFATACSLGSNHTHISLTICQYDTNDTKHS